MKKFKRPLIALLAIVIGIGLVPGSAMASGFLSGGYPAVFSGTVTTDLEIQLPADQPLQCDTGAWSRSNEATRGLQAVEVVPSSETSCTIGKSITTLKANGCKFIYRSGEEQEPGKFEGTLEIGPAGCGPMTFKYKSYGTVSIPAQTGLDVSYENVGNGTGATVDVRTDVTNLKYQFGGKEYETGSFERWSLEATTAGDPAGAYVSTQLPQGLYVTGVEYPEAETLPAFEAESYPAAISGAQDQSNKLAFATSWGASMACESANFSSSLGSSSASLDLAPQLSECSILFYGFKLEASVAMNSCHFVLSVEGTEAPAPGGIDIACTKAGDAIVIGAPNCKITIAPQEPGGIADLSNIGLSFLRGVQMDLNLSGIQDTHSGSTCGSGSSSGGTLEGTVHLRAFE